MILEIIWTTHAIERAGERFGFLPEIKIPNGMIQLIGARTDEGKKFRLGYGDVVYICVRVGDKVKIVTVQRKNNDNPRSLSNIARSSKVAAGSKRRCDRSEEADAGY